MRFHAASWLAVSLQAIGLIEDRPTWVKRIDRMVVACRQHVRYAAQRAQAA
jgi:hypothetical protein